MNMKVVAPASAASGGMSLIAQARALGSTGLPTSLFPGELAGYAAQAAVTEVLASWDNTMREGTDRNLIGDLDRTIDLIVAFRNRALALRPHGACEDSTGRAAADVVVVRGGVDPYVALMEVRESLDGLSPAITPASVEVDFVARARYFAEIALGQRQPFPQLDFSARDELLGCRVRFTAHHFNDKLSAGIVEGMLVAIEDTSGGNYRLSIRTDQPAAQGGGLLERRVYSNGGVVELIESPNEAQAAA